MNQFADFLETWKAVTLIILWPHYLWVEVIWLALAVACYWYLNRRTGDFAIPILVAVTLLVLLNVAWTVGATYLHVMGGLR